MNPDALAPLALAACVILAQLGALALEVHGDARAGDAGAVHYRAAAILSGLLAACALGVYCTSFDAPVAFFSAVFFCLLILHTARAACKVRLGARLKRGGRPIQGLLHSAQQLHRARRALECFFPRYWLPFYQPWVLFREGAIARAEMAAALGASAAAGVNCGLFFLTRIVHSRAALMRTPSGRTQWHAFFGALLCGTAFCLMATTHFFLPPAPHLGAPPVQPLEFLLMAFCLFGYPLRKLAFFLLFQCLEPLWLRWRNRQSFRTAYLRVRSQRWFEGVMALLAVAALVRAASADVAVLAVLHLACFALLMTPLALRVTQWRRRI